MLAVDSATKRTGPGQPEVYSEELAARVIAGIEDGRSVRSIAQDDGMPNRATIMRWVSRDDHGFRARYQEAVQVRAEVRADEVMDIADDGANDYVERTNKDGSTRVVLDVEAVMRSRLRVETRKWYLEKVLPKVYGPPAAAAVTVDARQVHMQVTSAGLERLASTPEGRAAARALLRDVAAPEAAAEVVEAKPETNGHAGNGHANGKAVE